MARAVPGPVAHAFSVQHPALQPDVPGSVRLREAQPCAMIFDGADDFYDPPRPGFHFGRLIGPTQLAVVRSLAARGSVWLGLPDRPWPSF